MEKNCEDSDTAIYKYQNREAITNVTGPVTDITTTHYDFTDWRMKYMQSGSDYSRSAGYRYDAR